MIAVDANIILEIAERRARLQAVNYALLKYQHKGYRAGISALSVSNVFYLAEAHKTSLPIIEKLVAGYKIYDVKSEDVDWALAHYGGEDFEDAVQVAAALREKCRSFLTLDAGLAKKYAKFLTIELIR